ncbi:MULTISPECIES: hypothetical protein [unclassified Roseivivax]|uniref:hypothetical protein n=1 Tax=unclassified Roseivivax TaxID=2639302 RepID=UPI001268093B|nr:MULTISPECIES: hypothetical protein [unclassified Roseivivax]
MRVSGQETSLGLALAMALAAQAPAPAQAQNAGDPAGDAWQSAGPLAELMGIANMPEQRSIDLTCRFETECVDGEACQPTEYEVTVTGRAGGLDAARMAVAATISTLSGDEESLGAFENGVLSVSGGEIDARFLLTVSEGGARLTQHYGDGPMAISYLGACK